MAASDANLTSVPRAFVLIGTALIIASLASRFAISWRMPFIMDEFVDVQLACDVAKGADLYVDRPWERTPLMTWLLGPLCSAASDSWHAVMLARLPFVVWSAVLVLFVALAASRAFGPGRGWLAAFLTLSCTTFLDHGLRVRADSLTTFLASATLLLMLRSGERARHMLASGVLLGAAFLTSQKAIYFAIAFAAAVVARAVVLRRAPLQIARCVALEGGLAAAGCVAVLGVFVAWLGVDDALAAFREQALAGAIRIGLVEKVYAGTTAFINQELFRSPVFWVLGLAGGLTSVVEAFRPDASNADRSRLGSNAALGAWCVVSVLCVAQHTAKFPYVFLTLVPGFAIAGSSLAFRILAALSGQPRWSWQGLTVGVAGTILLLVPALRRHHEHLAPNQVTEHQRAVIARVDRISTPEDAVFDGTGIVVKRPMATPYSMTARFYAELARGYPYDIEGWLRRTQPKVMIDSYRVRQVPPELAEKIGRWFVRDWANVFVAGASFKHAGGITEEEFELLGKAEYAISPGGAVSIDGSTSQDVVTLDAGVHRIRIEGAPRRVVIQWAPSVRHRPPEVTGDANLMFASYVD